jgi:chorismate mutase / prephenate dehydratase
MVERDLKTVRADIDALDVQIQNLITQRANLALEVARAKYAVESNPVFYRPEREAEILRNVELRNSGPLSNETLNRLFREIMSACLGLQKPLQVSYLGPEGTYSQAALFKYFGHAVKGVPTQTIEDVFREVIADRAHYGVVPIENSTEGSIKPTLEMLLNSPLQICGEVELPIHHCLMVVQPVDFKEIKRVYLHPQTFGQCRQWLAKNLSHAECLAIASSNADAARRAVDDKESAAVAGQNAAELYNLQILASQIEDELDNTTRFVILGKHAVAPTGRDKTSLILSAANRPGALHDMLESFKNKGLNLTRIESRPSRQGTWEYMFFVDVEGHINDPALADATQLIQLHSKFFKLLGSYPRAS